MSLWATRRKFIYSSIGMLLILLVLVPSLLYLYPDPTCSDQKKNRGESGVDCGGPCAKICLDSRESLRVLWARPFVVAPGVASAVALILNPNPALGAEATPYRLRLYDERNILIVERRGFARVPPNAEFPVFEGGLSVGNRVPARAFLEFLAEPEWRPQKFSQTLQVRNQVFTENPPSLEVDIYNTEVSVARDIEAYALIFALDGNALAASKTKIERLAGGSQNHLVFTWLAPFPKDSVVSERIYLIPLME